MEKFRFRKKDQEAVEEGPMMSQQRGYLAGNLQQQPHSYTAGHLQPRYHLEDTRNKQHTNWNGVLQDLFGCDSPQTAESTHESTSSGVASDVTSVYPATPTMSTFKGDSVSSACSAKSNGSQDSGTRSASISSSPKPEQTSLRHHLRPPSRMSPATPLPPVPSEPPPLPAKNMARLMSPSQQGDYHRMNAYAESSTVLARGKKQRERRMRFPETEKSQTGSDVNGRLMMPQSNGNANNSDPRVRDPSFYNEINHGFMEAMRAEQYIETLGGERFGDPNLQETFNHKDRPRAVPSPVSPVPPGGYYHNRDVPVMQQNNWLPSDVNQRDSRARQKQLQQHYLQQQQQLLQQQQHSQPYQQNSSTQKLITSSPVNNDSISSVPFDFQNSQNRHMASSNRVKNDRTSPSIQSSNLNKLSGSGNNILQVTRAANSTRNLSNDPQADTMNPRIHSSNSRTQGLNPKSQNTIFTQAQVHSSGNDVRSGHRVDGRVKLGQGLSDTQLNSASSPGTHRGNGLVGGVKGLSLSQNDLKAVSAKGKGHVSRTTPFESLPTDVLLKVFSHLPTDHLCKCAQVCRHWYNVVWDNPILWTSIVINNPNIDIDKALKYLTRRLSYNTPKICMILEKININACCRLTDRGLQTAVKRCPELRYLDMQGCHLITNLGVTEAVSRCVNLERLDVTGCPNVTCITLMDSVIAQNPSHLERIYLRYLDMTDCPHVTDEDLFIITSQCPQLLFFYLRRCPLITDLGVSYIANNCSSLRELSMSDCTSITDMGMRELAKLRENLRYLSVAKCEKVSDDGVIHIARNCSKLRYLNVRGCETVSDLGLEFLVRNCPRLRSLDIGKCDITDEGMFALSRYCPNLKKLGVKSCDGITDKGIVLVAYSCSSLQQLHVQDCCLSPDAYAMVRRYCKRAIIEHTNPGLL